MKLRKSGGLVLCIVLSTGMIRSVDAANNSGAVLLNPRQDEKVANVIEVTGKVLMQGFPIVLVRSEQPDSLWWAQELAKGTSHGHFKTAVRVGNDKTPDGTRFQIVVLMVPPDDAKTFEPGTSFKELPAYLARSPETVVVLERPEDPKVEVLDLIQLPKKGLVKRVDSISCSKLGDTQPIILVRSDDANEVWWVQSASQPDKDGHFVSSAHFGNEKTPSGTHFQIVAIFPDAEFGAKLRPGMSLKELPKGVPHSAEVKVVRNDNPEVSRPTDTSTEGE